MASITYSSPTFTTFTNIGPITTSLSFPPDCYTDHYDFQTWGLGFPWRYTTAGTCTRNISERDFGSDPRRTPGCAISSCCPSGKYYSQGFAWMTSYYSPGLYCPSNYHTCSPPPSPYQLSSASGETIAFCCPSTWESQTGGGGIVYDGCNSGFSTGSQVVTVADNIYDQSSLSQYTFTETGITTLWQIAWPIQIRWQSSDFITSLIQSTSTGIAVTGPTSTSKSTLPVPSPSRLSSGAISGIVVGSLIGAALLIGFPLFLFFFRRRHARSTQPVNNEPSGKPELSGDGKRLFVPHPSVYPQPNAELEGSDSRGPISASWNRHSLDPNISELPAMK
ncbi:uncharacterized protein K444DRAFT_635816 [Hyaloscypha bicolor E]|uniref:Uncharacterized protein n=1 Tax=Hyaloscypha bicolor E TaxID=1095630 RepID=A0A2J6SQ49_9HELO|nr:uncharacterized protein K444DRAFT_635816 [Hyaloscypha bicolor E]PMD52881.1 hypothetical protein K444DRAFT_635816 [Hyaloscypha bicolor E]